MARIDTSASGVLPLKSHCIFIGCGMLGIRLNSLLGAAKVVHVVESVHSAAQCTSGRCCIYVLSLEARAKDTI